MTRWRIVANPARVFDFVCARSPMAMVAGLKGLGLERDGCLVAGVVYEGFNGCNMFIHVAAEPGRRWLNRRFLYEVFYYPFVTCGVQRLTGYVEASNTEARRFDEHLGFAEEARLKGAASDGGDVILYVMHRQGCRFLNSRYGQEEQESTT